jgi:hypothetical protein
LQKRKPGAGLAEAELATTDLLEHVEVLSGPFADRYRLLANAFSIEKLFEQLAARAGDGETGERVSAQLADGARHVDAASAGLVSRRPAPELLVGQDVGDGGALVDGRIHGERRDREHEAMMCNDSATSSQEADLSQGRHPR